MRKSRALMACAVALIVMLLTLGLGGASAATEGDEQRYGGWQFEVTPYFWLPETHGTVSFHDVSADVDIDLDDIFDLLGDGDLFGGMGHFEARKDKLALFVDTMGAVVEADAAGQILRDRVDVHADLDFDMCEAPGVPAAPRDVRVVRTASGRSVALCPGGAKFAGRHAEKTGGRAHQCLVFPACPRAIVLASGLHVRKVMRSFGTTVRRVLATTLGDDLHEARAGTLLPLLNGQRQRETLRATLGYTFGIALRDEDLDQLRTVDDVLRCIHLRRWEQRARHATSGRQAVLDAA